MSYKVLRRLQNPELVKNIPTYDFSNNGKLKRTQLVYTCGFGGFGSLGIPKYYRPDQKEESKVRDSDQMSATFRRLKTVQISDKVKHIACGFGFTILAGRFEGTSHTAVGFGFNSHSQLGYHAPRAGFPLEIVNTPSPIFHPSKSCIVQASCGRAHSLLLDEDGHVFSIGDNSLGQCGRPIEEDENYFGSKKINSLKDDLPEKIVSIECGQDHSFFLTDKGELYSCGWGADGQTGLGHFDNQWKPSKVKGDIQGVNIKKVSSFADTTLAIDHEGTLFGWGNTEYAQFRQLAGCELEQFSDPRHLKLKNIPGKIVDIAAGGTICAILNDRGQVFVWGFGILGLGPEVDQSSRPKLIPETLFGQNHYNTEAKIEQIHASLDHFAAVSNTGDLYAWGRNRGQSLGFKHKGDQYFPMRVNVNLAVVKKVALGVDHTCLVAEKIC